MIKLLLYQVIWPAILDLERVGTGVMLNGDDNENGFKTVNSSNQQKKTNCTCSKLFVHFFAVVLHDYKMNAVLHD